MTESGCRIFTLKMMFGRHINYSYIVLDQSSRFAAVVDPSWDLGKILGMLKTLDASLMMILLTHSHFDHVNLVEPLIKALNPQVMISSKEQEWYNFSSQNLVTVGHLDQVRLGDSVISCLLTPGHTAGGMCYLVSGNLFTGDTVFIEGCGVCTTQGGCPETMFESIQMLKRSLDPSVKVYPGHSYGRIPGYDLAFLLDQNIYFQIDRKEMFVDFRMRKGQRNLFDFK